MNSTRGLFCGVGALLLGATALGCSSLLETSAISSAPTWLSHPSGDLQVNYRRNLVAVSRQNGEPYEKGRPAIDALGGRVFVGSSDRGLYALRAHDGQALWRFETLGAVQSEPVYAPDENAVYFGSNDGALYKVRADDGALIWRFASNAEVSRRVELTANHVYFVNANDTVVALTRASGERRWSQHRSPAHGMEIAGHAGLLLFERHVFVASSTGTITAYDAETGDEVWQPVELAAEVEQVQGATPTYLDADATPVGTSIGGLPAVVVAGYAGGVVALSAETGGQLWSNPGVLGATDVTLWEQAAHEDLSRSQRFPERRVLVISTGTSGIWGLDPETGDELWRRGLSEGGTNRPSFIAGAMLVTTTRHGIYLMSPLDGAVIDGIHNQLGFSQPAATWGNRGFVLSNGGQFLALSVAPPQR